MLINAECALLLWGLYRILSGDPGIVACDSSYLEEAGCKDFVEAIFPSELPMLSRVRQCNWCKANVRGYDHHCPAFGTCIGQKNHRLFMALLTGFVVAESTYTMCSTKCMLFVSLICEMNFGFFLIHALASVVISYLSN
jgi:hypothetical protein